MHYGKTRKTCAVSEDTQNFRPAEVETLLGDASKVRENQFRGIGARGDVRDLKAEHDNLVHNHGYRTPDRQE